MVSTSRNKKCDSTDVMDDVVDLTKSPLSEAKLTLKMEEEDEDGKAKEKMGKGKGKGKGMRKDGKEKDDRSRYPSGKLKKPTKKETAASRPEQAKLGNLFGSGKATTVKKKGDDGGDRGERGENEGDTSERGKEGGNNEGEKVGNVKCPNYGKGCEKRELKAHLKSCRKRKRGSKDDNEEEGECPECWKVMLKKDMKKHLKGCKKRKRGSGNEEEHEEQDEKNETFWCQPCEKQFVKEDVTKHSAVCKGRARWKGEEGQGLQGNNELPTTQVEDLPIPDGRPSQDPRADFFDIFHHSWPQLEDTPAIGTTPHNLNTLRAATNTLLKGVHRWEDVLDNAVAAIDESRDDLPFIVVRQEDLERRGEAWEAYTLWSSLASQVGVAGRICGFPQYSYVDRATNDGRCGYVDPKVEAHIEMEEEGLRCPDSEGNFTEEEVRAAITSGGIRAKDLFARFKGRIERQTGGVRQFWRTVTRLASTKEPEGLDDAMNPADPRPFLTLPWEGNGLVKLQVLRNFNHSTGGLLHVNKDKGADARAEKKQLREDIINAIPFDGVQQTDVQKIFPSRCEDTDGGEIFAKLLFENCDVEYGWVTVKKSIRDKKGGMIVQLDEEMEDLEHV